MRYFKIYLISVLAFFLFACSDDDDEAEYSFDREVFDYTIIKECSPGAPEGKTCFKIRYHYPIRRDDYSGLCVWLDHDVVDSSALSVNDRQIEKAHKEENHAFFKKYEKTDREFDTLDLTDYIGEFLEKKYDSLHVALFCEYSDGGKAGLVLHTSLPFRDVEPPGVVTFRSDSVWSTGAWFEWFRPTDIANVQTVSEGYGPIYGYWIVIYAKDSDEDLRDLDVIVQTPSGFDYQGNKFYKRNAQIKKNTSGNLRELKVEEIAPGIRGRNYLDIVVLDGNSYDPDNVDNNRFRLTINGLRTQSNKGDKSYSIGIVSWDISGNASPEITSFDPTKSKEFMTTDSIAPLVPTKIYTIEDSLFPGYTRLDSNNRVAIFWNRSVDPLMFKHGIDVDTQLTVPSGCNMGTCFSTELISRYVIEYYNKLDKSWNAFPYGVGGVASRYVDFYKRNADGDFYPSASANSEVSGVFVTDTLRWVAPGDTIILRIRAVDSSKYYSNALVDTLFISPGILSTKLNCPKGFVAVSTSDTTSFCMEQFEHRGADGKFMTNVLHSEAVAACEAVSASGFDVSLCRERDWELVCLSGGTLPYGFIEENDSISSGFLFRFCNVSTNDSVSAASIVKRSPYCMNPMGVRDLPGQYQEWVMGRSEDTIAVLKGASYKVFQGIDQESIAYCTNRAFPFYTRLGYTQDTVYLYREGTMVDTIYSADTTRTLYKILTKKDFKDTLQFYDVIDAKGNVIGKDFSLYSEYKKGGKTWLDSISNGLTYKPTSKEAVFLTGEKFYYRQAASFYKSSSIGFRCCAYKK